MAAKLKPWTADETRRHVERLFGTDKTADRVAAALGLGSAGRVTVFRWLRGEPCITAPAQIALDLMARCPRDQLPARLRALMVNET